MVDRFDFNPGRAYRPRTMRRTLLFVASALIAYSTAFGQGEDPKDPKKEAAPPAQDLFGIDASSIPNDEKKARIEAMLVEMRAALTRANDLLGEARNAKDVVM